MEKKNDISDYELKARMAFEAYKGVRNLSELMADIQLKRSIELEYPIKNVNKIDERQFMKYDLTQSEININNIFNKIGLDTRHELLCI